MQKLTCVLLMILRNVRIDAHCFVAIDVGFDLVASVVARIHARTATRTAAWRDGEKRFLVAS